MTAVIHKKRLLTLPPDVQRAFDALPDRKHRDAYIASLRRSGWTLDSIAKMCNVSRERIRQITAAQDSIGEIGSIGMELPAIPTPPIKEVKEKRTYVEPSPEVLARLLELQPLAQQVRSSAKRYRAEAEEYTRLLDQAHRIEGVTIYRLAKRLGITHSAIRFRLARYGYKPSINGKGKVYQPIVEANRVK